MRASTTVRIALAGTLALAACGGSRPAGPALPAGPQVVDLQLREYSFHYNEDIRGGRVLFRVVNDGRIPHSLSLLPLTDDIPPIDRQLLGTERRAVAPFARVRSRWPGTSTTFAVDLAPGVRYAFVCFLDDPEGKPHWLRGMSSEFRAGERQASGREE